MSRLYYTNSHLTTFTAVVTACEAVADGRWHVRLDRTAFYPTSGGQPFDTGRLGGVAVVDVLDEEGGGIVHVLEGPIDTGGEVQGEVDWARRRDHMQQHTGQHVLSAAFDRRFGVRTVSFHLGAETATIDLAREVTRREIDQAEADANDVVWDDRPVTVRFVNAEEAAALPLRKDPTRTGELRLVEIESFDLSACGGTHVPRTGMIGQIAVSGWERFKGATRLTFVCGGRALAAHGRLRDVVTESVRHLSVAPADLPGQIGKVQADLAAAARQVKQAQDQLAVYRAAEWRALAETIGPVRGVLREAPGHDGNALRSLASAIVSEPGLVAVLVGDGTPVPVVAARSGGVEFDAAGWMKAAVAALGGRGGGRPDLAQGGLSASGETILAFARQALSA
jgi:alanyl-tRNA synthetase